jgi:hypothetical protein
MSDLGYRPLVYMWIAEFSDGSALSQFDPETGKENKADPDWLPSASNQPSLQKLDIWMHKRILRFSWCPFSLGLAQKISEATGQIVIPSSNPIHCLELKNGEKLVAYRSNILKYGFSSGKVQARETVYMLGKIGGKILKINEDGSDRFDI